MWQLYVLGALLANAGENVIDKAAIVQNVTIDFFVASFWRPFLYVVAVVVIGLIGVLGPLHFAFYWSILALAPFGIFTTLFYTYMLQRVELTSMGAAAYITPLIFLFIDADVVHVGLSHAQMLGIVLLVAGGIGFVVDWKNFRLKPELDWRVWCMFLFGIIYGGIEAYLFKYLHAVHGMNGVSFFATTWLLCSALLLLFAVLAGRAKLLFVRPSRIYMVQSSVSKSFDALNSVFSAQALTLAAVSQVSAFEASYPLILFLAVLFVQGVLRIPLKEHFDRKRFAYKAVATVLLIAGGLLVS